MDVQKRKKNYFTNNGYNQKKRKQLSLEAGMTGFLCTCNFREKDCVRDAYKLLNEFADEMYGSDKTKTQDEKESTVEKNESAEGSEHEDADDDISDALNKEISELKAEYAKPVAARRFQAVDTGVKNVIFIRSTLSNPLELVTKIVTDLDRSKQQRTRFLLRLIPIEVVCKAYMNDIKLKASVLFEKYFSQEPKTFSIVFNRHSNNNIHRDEVIEDLAEIINQKNPGNKADLKNPEIAVVVEVIRGTCLISIAPDYYKFKKYNLLEICNVKKLKNDKEDKKQEEIEKTETTNKGEDLEVNKSSLEETSDKKEEIEQSDNSAS